MHKEAPTRHCRERRPQDGADGDKWAQCFDQGFYQLIYTVLGGFTPSPKPSDFGFRSLAFTLPIFKLLSNAPCWTRSNQGGDPSDSQSGRVGCSQAPTAREQTGHGVRPSKRPLWPLRHSSSFMAFWSHVAAIGVNLEDDKGARFLEPFLFYMLPNVKGGGLRGISLSS